MGNWKYRELLDAINETFDEQLLQGLSPLEAIGVTSENFMFHPTEDNKVENLITLIETIFLCLNNLDFVYETTVERYNKQKLTLTEEEIKSSLLKDEYDLFMERLGELEFKLVHSEIKPIL